MRKLMAWVLALGFLLTGCGAQAEEGTLTAVFYNVGKADAILLRTDQAAVLIDTGKNKGGDQILEDLQARGIEKLDALIITHFDKDHVGGADAILAGIPVARVIEPAYAKESKQFTQYRDALEAAKLVPEMLLANASFEIDGCRYEIDVANEDFYGEDEENDFSLVVRLTHGNIRFLFAGDAENPRLGELLDEGDLACDILKVPHHGQYEKLSPLFFEAASPAYAVITSDAKDLEAPETVIALQMAGAQVLLTREGTVQFTSDGKTVAVKN